MVPLLWRHLGHGVRCLGRRRAWSLAKELTVTGFIADKAEVTFCGTCAGARTRHARTPGENPARPGRLLRFPVPVACGSAPSRR